MTSKDSRAPRFARGARALAKTLFTCVFVLLACMALVACDTPPSYKQLPDSPFAGRETADLSGYTDMAGYEGESRLVKTDVLEVLELMDAGESFVLFCGYEQCPYCNKVLPYFNDTAIAADTYVGYIDTRSNPNWKSNTDMDNYDLFAERFGQWIDTDEDGSPHLYVPESFFIKDGQIVSAYAGVVEGADDPSVALTSAQESKLMKNLSEEFNRLA